jgi:hypothetical protein
MLRIKFLSDKDCVDGNYILMTHTSAERLRGDVFEIADNDRKLLDEHQLRYAIVPLEANGADQEIRTTYDVQRRNGD